MEISESYVCKHVRINLFEAFDTKGKKLSHFSVTSFLLCLLPSCLPHWLWMFSRERWEYHLCSSQLSSEGQRRCLKVPLESAESDSKFPATATFHNSPLLCWPKYLPLLKHTNYICDANIAPACARDLFRQSFYRSLIFQSRENKGLCLAHDDSFAAGEHWTRKMKTAEVEGGNESCSTDRATWIQQWVD